MSNLNRVSALLELMKKACWEVMDCGKGPSSDQPCSVVENDLADGFLNGQGGSRACFYTTGTLCFENDFHMSVAEKLQTYCMECDFYKQVIQEEGIKSNLFYYIKYIHDKLRENDRLEDLPLIQLSLFQVDQ